MPSQLKTYSADTGYVYQYYFVGQRAALADDPEAPSTEYVFDVIAGPQEDFRGQHLPSSIGRGSLGGHAGPESDRPLNGTPE